MFVDGSAFLIQIVRREWFFDFYPPRLYAMIVGQLPIMTAVTLGMTDLHWLGRLLSLGLFSLPTFVYTLALTRAKRDPVLLAVVITAIALVFMTTSFFIVGEYNTLYALTLLVAVQLATADRLRLGESLFLAAIAAFAMRTYETMIYLGPLLAAMTLWRVWRVPQRPVIPVLLHVLAAGCFLNGWWIAFDSVVIHPWSTAHLDETWEQAKFFWQNMQFDWALGATLTIAIWALVRPEDLRIAKPYRWAALMLVGLALSPLLALSDTLIRPLAKSQYVARTVSGLIIATMMVFIWLYGSQALPNWRVRTALQTPEVRRRLLAFVTLMPFAMLPSDLFLTSTWVSYLNAMRVTVVSRPGLIPYEETPMAHLPDFLLVENWALSTQSLALRSRQGDGIILPPKDFKDWVPFPPSQPPNIGRFFWRD